MQKKVSLELFYTLSCPNCKTMKRLLEEVLPNCYDAFEFKQTNASMPFGMVKTLKYGIFSVPTLLINDKIVFKSVPTKKELINKLNEYLSN